MILISNVKVPLDADFSNVSGIAARALRVEQGTLKSARLYRRSVDARRKSDIHFCCSFLVEINGDEAAVLRKNKSAQLYNEKAYEWKKASIRPEKRPVIIGFGPAGMFAAITLSRAGLCPIVLERGQDIDTRTADVNAFFAGGGLNTESNVQFGAGGAGTFSDGKLNTGIKDVRCRQVLECFVQLGAPERILTDAKPHIGTDILKTVVKNLQSEIISLGGQVRYGMRLEGLSFEEGRLSSITASDETIACDSLILAIGHSARDTYEMLLEGGLKMERKPFSIGVRIEHLQSDINKAMYGSFWDNKALTAADYKLSAHLNDGRGVYSFCMCPGGSVINASSEAGGLAVNGMSESARDGKNANSALLVGVEPQDIEGTDILGGCYLQREIEQKAYKIGNGRVPVSTVGEFVFGENKPDEVVSPTVLPDTVSCDFDLIFPKFITESLKIGICEFDKKIRGFASKGAILSAPETRSSAPVRILRDDERMAIGYRGVFPCGEGAGYAGGIMSAAVDGMKSAEALIDFLEL